MKLKKIQWKNFKSYSNIISEINFEENSSLNLIVGENGSGKSSIAEVITYSLYGKIENFKSSDIPNRINKNYWSKIDVDCDGHNVIIIRGLSPNLFEVTIDGKSIDTAGKNNVQSMLEENYLKIPYSVFRNTIVLSINDFKSLVDLNAADKRNIIDKIFGFGIYNQLNKIIKDEQKNIIYNINSNDGSIRASKENISNYTRQINEIKENISSKEEIDDLLKKIKIAEDTKKKNDELIQKLDNAKNELNKTTLEKSVAYKDIQRKLNEIDDKISLIESGKCPTCGSSLDTDEFIQEKEKLIEEKEICIKNMQIIKDTLIQIKSKLNAVDKKTNTLKQENNKTNLIDLKTDYRYKMSIKESNIDPLEKLKSELDYSLKSLNDEREQLEKTKNVFDVMTAILGDGGIKTYIAGRYVPIINQIMSNVLSIMNLNYVVKFDNNFNSSITHNGYNVNYSTMSTGEKKKVDFACVISIIKFLKLQLGELNLLFLDELFSNIDINGVSSMMDLLRDLCEEMKLNIYLIHHAQLEGILFDKILNITKPDGFSRIEIKE